MNCTFDGTQLRNIGDKRINNDTIERTVKCDSCGTVKTYQKVYPKSFSKKMRIIPTEEGYVVNPHIVTIRKKGFVRIREPVKIIREPCGCN